MKKDIIRIYHEDNGVYTDVPEDVTLAEVFEGLVLALAETSELMLSGLNDIELHKTVKEIKHILNVSVDESYLK